MTAQFKAEDTLIIRGRGMVLTGRVLEGTLRLGMAVTIEGFPRTLSIDGFEMINSQNLMDGLVGLLFLSTDQQDITLWKRLDVKEKVLKIMETDIRQ
jgi:translation elongation factor EF-Tu-like GTPase